MDTPEYHAAHRLLVVCKLILINLMKSRVFAGSLSIQSASEALFNAHMFGNEARCVLIALLPFVSLALLLLLVKVNWFRLFLFAAHESRCFGRCLCKAEG